MTDEANLPKIIFPVIGFIFARGGSKGVPRKNVRPLAGKPLIGHSIDAAKASRYIERVFVSTDDYEIAAVAKELGAEVPFLRPEELAQHKSAEILSWRHAIRAVKELCGVDVGTFVSVPATSPLRLPSDIDVCVEAHAESGADLTVTVTSSRHHPRFSMVKLDEEGIARLLDQGGPRHANRQEAPPVYDMTGVAFVARPEYVMSAQNLFAGRIRAVKIPEERAIDIDTMLDFEIADFLVARAREG